jgi:hypothetical protein
MNIKHNLTFFQSQFTVRFCLLRQTEQFRGNCFWQCVLMAWVKGEELWKKIRIEFQHSAEQSAYRFMKLRMREGSRPEGFYSQSKTTSSICETFLSVDTCVYQYSSLHVTLMISKEGQHKHVNVYGMPVYLTPQRHWWASFRELEPQLGEGGWRECLRSTL